MESGFLHHHRKHTNISHRCKVPEPNPKNSKYPPRLLSSTAHPGLNDGTSYLLNVIITQSPSILKLLAGEDQTLLIWGNALFVLDFGLDVVDCIAGFDFEGDGFAR